LKNIVNHDVWLKIKLDVELLDGLNFRNENAKTNIAPLMIRNCSIMLKLCGGTSLALLDLALGGRAWLRRRLRFIVMNWNNYSPTIIILPSFLT